MLHVFPTWAKVIAIGSAAIAADQYLIERQLKPMQRKLDKLDTDVKSRLDKLDTDVRSLDSKVDRLLAKKSWPW